MISPEQRRVIADNKIAHIESQILVVEGYPLGPGRDAEMSYQKWRRDLMAGYRDVPDFVLEARLVALEKEIPPEFWALRHRIVMGLANEHWRPISEACIIELLLGRYPGQGVV